MTNPDDELEIDGNFAGDELRMLAIAKWKKQEMKTGPISLSEPKIRELIHELQIHQIELEMQNEELRRVQVELDESKARYYDLFELAPVGYCIVSEKGLILEANLTVALMLGLEKSSLVKQPLSNFIMKEDQDIYYLHRKKLFETGKPQMCELQMVKKDGTYIWVYLDATTVQKIHSQPVCRITISDITLRKREDAELLLMKEALEAANQKLQIALTREKQLSNTDVLTGVCNRRHFYEIAANEFYATVRYEHPLTVILIDVDDFKLFNDNFGHATGDKVLEHVALAASTQIRKIDVLARYGGDEFIILLPQTKAKDAFPVAERIRESIAARRIENDKNFFNVSISIGIAEIRHSLEGESIETIIKRADKALYRAKSTGRNCTVIHGE